MFEIYYLKKIFPYSNFKQITYLEKLIIKWMTVKINNIFRDN